MILCKDLCVIMEEMRKNDGDKIHMVLGTTFLIQVDLFIISYKMNIEKKLICSNKSERIKDGSNKSEMKYKMFNM
jgi:hypothetical protein